MPINWSDEDYEVEGKNEDKLLDAINCYTGRSDRDDASTLARPPSGGPASSRGRGSRPGSRARRRGSRSPGCRCKVGNPNIKIYSATLTKTQGGGH